MKKCGASRTGEVILGKSSAQIRRCDFDRLRNSIYLRKVNNLQQSNTLTFQTSFHFSSILRSYQCRHGFLLSADFIVGHVFNSHRGVFLKLPRGHTANKQFVDLLQTAVLHFRHEEVTEDNAKEVRRSPDITILRTPVESGRVDEIWSRERYQPWKEV